MSGTPPSSIVATETPPVIRSPASESIHNEFLESAIPQWLTDATGPRRAALKKQGQDLPGGYPQVSPEQRKAITVAATASFISQTALDKALSEFMDIDTFAEPLLVAALMQQCRVTLDVRKTVVRLMKPVEMGLLAIDISSFEVLKLPLLQAALHNFEEAECETDAFHESSGFLLQGATSDTFEPLATSLTVAQFTRLCRSLDIGAKYQDYLAGYFKTADGVLDQALQLKFIAAQKDALWAAAEWALHKEHIERADYEMIMSVIRGEVHPRLNGKSVWFQDLSLMKHRMTGCVLFSIGGSNHHLNELILYVPQDPVTDSIISGLEGRLSELPLLSGHTFSSVRILSLSDLRVPAEQIRGFVRAFPDATEVSLRGCGLTEFLLTPNDLPALEILALQDNPLKTVDVRGMNNLKALMLGATELSEWPMGVEDMPNLTCLDLRNSSLATLPEAFLARDELVLNTHLGGTPLTRQTRADLKVARQRVERAHILPAGALERLAAEEVPSPLQPLRVGPRLSKGLWTLPPAEILEGEGALSLEARLQRLLPGFTEDSARRWLVATSAKGLTRLDIHELINGWNQELETLTRELNGWLLNRYSQVKQINDLRKAGFQIIARWREGTVAPDVDRALDLSGMKLGVMPELSLQLPGVTTLDLSGMELSTPGCEAFLRSFGNVRTLRLSNNPLNVLPSALSSMERLERLELSGAELGESAPVSEMLHHLKHLKWLDLSENRLGWDFDLTGFEALETLDMSHNCLHVWPKGIFESKTLKTLNLAKNQFEYLPPALFEGRHGELVKGINISGNPIQISDLRKIRDNFPAQAHSRPRFTGRYLGYTADEITQEIKDNRNSSDEDSDASLSN